MLKRLLGAFQPLGLQGGGVPLSEQRRSLYRYTHPAVACASAAAAACVAAADGRGWLRDEPAVGNTRGCMNATEAACLLPFGVASALGALSAVRGCGGFSWLSSAHERMAWVCAFGGAAVSTAEAVWPTVARGDAPHTPVLGPSAAFLLSATISERLGTRTGLLLAAPLASCAGAAAVAAARGDRRPSRWLDTGSMLLLPLLLACPPVHTHTAGCVLALAWFGAAGVYRGLEDAEGQRHMQSASHLLLALGAASLAWTIRVRSPICRY